MRTRAGWIQRRVGTAARTLGRDAVTVCWTETTGGTLDPVTKAVVGGIAIERSSTVNALVHWPQVGGSTAARQFAEIEEGDVIVDLPAEDAVRLLDGKADLAFLIQGVRHRQKRVSGRLAASWDAVVAGVQLFRPLLLEVAQ